jgi:hypothetical protein
MCAIGDFMLNGGDLIKGCIACCKLAKITAFLSLGAPTLQVLSIRSFENSLFVTICGTILKKS